MLIRLRGWSHSGMVVLNFDGSCGCFKARDGVEEVKLATGDVNVFKASKDNCLRLADNGLGFTVFGGGNVRLGSDELEVSRLSVKRCSDGRLNQLELNAGSVVIRR